MTVVTKPLETAGPAVAARKQGRGLSRVFLHIIVIGLMVLWVVPTLGLFVNSFRQASDVARSGWWEGLLPPWDFTLDNYSRVIAANNLGDAFINSLFITIPSTIIPILLAAFAAYGFAWMRFPGRRLFDWALLAAPWSAEAYGDAIWPAQVAAYALGTATLVMWIPWWIREAVRILEQGGALSDVTFYAAVIAFAALAQGIRGAYLEPGQTEPASEAWGAIAAWTCTFGRQRPTPVHVLVRRDERRHHLRHDIGGAIDVESGACAETEAASPCAG